MRTFGGGKSKRVEEQSMWIDRAIAAVGLVMATPALLACAVAIWLEDGTPILFRQQRVGRYGVFFELLKFRSMRKHTRGAMLTAGGDCRVTQVGSFLRRFKLDELPQLWNVVRGEMNLIGPRPEVPQYVDMSDPTWQAVLEVRPGITDLATLVYRNEEQILADAEDLEEAYRRSVLPHKLALNLAYLQQRSFFRDLKLVLLTVRFSFMPAGFNALRVKTAILPKET